MVHFDSPSLDVDSREQLCGCPPHDMDPSFWFVYLSGCMLWAREGAGTARSEVTVFVGGFSFFSLSRPALSALLFFALPLADIYGCDQKDVPDF